jgi:hypothetical protein
MISLAVVNKSQECHLCKCGSLERFHASLTLVNAEAALSIWNLLAEDSSTRYSQWNHWLGGTWKPEDIQLDDYPLELEAGGSCGPCRRRPVLNHMVKPKLMIEIGLYWIEYR